jgi:hypothetical protein
LIAGSYCLNWLAQREGTDGGGDQARRVSRRRTVGERRKERGAGKEKREAPTGGAPVSATAGKRKEERKTRGATGKRKMGRWAER